MKIIRVHKIVAFAFFNKLENNKANNCLNNLRFCNTLENAKISLKKTHQALKA